MDDKDKEGWAEVKLLPVGRPLVSSDTYPPEVMEQAIQDLMRRRGLAPLAGECDTDYQGRFTTVAQERVAYAIDPMTLKIKDGFVVGMARPSGPFAELAKTAFQSIPTFAMRALVQYKEGNTTQTKNRTAIHCDIISFDLVNPTE